MSEMQLPKDHPAILAFERYKASDEFHNTFKWATYAEHRTGSMWAAFYEGFQAALSASPPMTDSAEKMREAIKRFYRNGCYHEALDFEVDALVNELAALSASGTKSDGALRCGVTGNLIGTDTVMVGQPECDCSAHQAARAAPGPSDPISSQPDEREAIAEQLQGWADFIDTEAAQSMSVASAAYANGGSLADDLRSAILAMLAERRDFTCAARKQSLPEPADCDWPVCGCDPYADKVIAALEESGALKDQSQHPAPIAGLEPVAWQSRQKFNLERAAMGNIGGWSECSSDEATDHWACRPEREYRGLFTRAQLEAHAAEQVRAEREACAKIAEEMPHMLPMGEKHMRGLKGIDAAAAIRARGQV